METQLGLFDEMPATAPIVPRVETSETSCEAAKKIEKEIKTQLDEEELEKYLFDDFDGLTDEEARLIFNWSESYERPRRWSLVQRGLAYKSEVKRVNRGGKLMTVWKHVRWRGMTEPPVKA